MQKYNKALIAVAGMALTFFYDSFGPQMGLPAEWAQETLALATPILVYLIPNKAES